MTENTITSKPPVKSRKNLFWNIFWSGFWVILTILVLLKFFVYQQVNVVGASMEPSYHTGELLLVDQLNKNLKRGQVVAVYEDKDVAKTADYFTRFQTRFFLKRVIGLPGEEIEMVGSKVIIYNSEYPNGAILSEDYIGQETKNKEETTNYYYPRTKIPENQYFCLGDNRDNSIDSRIKGTFPDYAIFGQETIRFWPSDKFGLFKLPTYNYRPVDEETRSAIEKLKINNSRNRLLILSN